MENVIKGFFGLMEGGEEQYNQLKESGAIDRTVGKVTAAIKRLNMTPAAIIQLFIGLWNSFSIYDLMDPVAAFRRILDQFGQPILRLIAFVIEIVKIVIEAILMVMNFPIDIIRNIITRAMAAFQSIRRDPVGFLINLLRAIKQGFIQFFDNILQHLIQGLVGWLMSELRDAGVPQLTDLSLRGVIAWVMEILNITMEKIWEKLAAHPRIGPQRVARIRSMINTLEGIWTFIRDVQERGMAAIWDKIQEQLSNLWTMIIDAVKNWIMERIITQVVTKLLSMLDPTGIMAVVNSVIAIYKAIQSFIKYLREMLEVVNSFVMGVADIAAGNIATAANYLERTMSRTMPIVIGFLANQVGLGGIGRRVGEMIERARELVDRALTWLVNKAVDTGMALLDRAMALGARARDAVLGWLGIRKTFNTNSGVRHNMYLRGSGENISMIIESTPTNMEVFLAEKRIEINGSTLTPEEKSVMLGKVAQCETKNGELRRLIYPSNRRTPAPPDQETLINNKMDEIMNLIKELDVGASAQIIPPAQISPGFSGSKARELNVQYLHNGPGNHAPGTPARNYRGNLSGAKTKLGMLGLSSRWVAFHVLNENLGGLAVDSNLVPTPMYINNEYKDSFETTMKTRHDAGEVLWMTALFEYRTTPLEAFLKHITVQGGSMKLENGSWISDSSKLIPLFSKDIDEPSTESFMINDILMVPAEWMLVTNLSSVTYRTLEILKDNKPASGYTSMNELDMTIDANIHNYGYSNPTAAAATSKRSLRSISITF
jgi:phage-related protein